MVKTDYDAMVVIKSRGDRNEIIQLIIMITLSYRYDGKTIYIQVEHGHQIVFVVCFLFCMWCFT